jgi:hypothetical protein
MNSTNPEAKRKAKNMNRSKIIRLKPIVFFICLVLLPAMSGLGAASELKTAKGQLVYVPIYSHIYSGDREHPFYLAATLSIRNIDPKHAITLLAADYYDSEGKLIKKVIEKPTAIKSFASMRFVIKESDKIGGSGAGFIIKWQAEQSVNAPIIESVMIGTQTQQGISFTSRGQVIGEK